MCETTYTMGCTATTHKHKTYEAQNTRGILYVCSPTFIGGYSTNAAVQNQGG